MAPGLRTREARERWRRGCTYPFVDAVRPSELYRFFERTYRAPGAAEERERSARDAPGVLRPGAEPEAPS